MSTENSDRKAGDLLVTTTTCPVNGGDPQPRFVLDLAASLLPYFQRVHLLAPGAPGAANLEVVGGVNVHRFQYAWPAGLQKLCYRHGIMQNIRANPLLLGLLPGLVMSQIAAVRRICREYPVEIINSHWFLFQSVAAALACRDLKVRHVPHSHGADVYLLRRMSLTGRALARFVATRAQGMICESTYVRDQLDALLGYVSGAAVSCMGVDARQFQNGAGTTGQRVRKSDQTVLFVGRLVEKKGVEYLIRAMVAVRRTRPGSVLKIVGHGVLESRLKELAGQLGLLGQGVEFLGSLRHAEIAGLLAECSVVALPSIIDSHGEADGMPTVLLEAMAAGRLVVASRVNGIPDVLKDGENGWLSEPRNSADLAEKILAALSYEGAAVQGSARATAEQYDWPMLGKRYAALLAACRA